MALKSESKEMKLNLAHLDRQLDGRKRIDLCSSPLISGSSYKETFILVALFGLLIYVLAKPAFDGFFISEDFNWTSLYLAADKNFFRAIFTPFGQFFRPASIAWVIGTQLLLPWEPLLHHTRNFLFTLVNLFLLHRIMLRVTISPIARVFGMAFFAFSKVHLTTIGLINVMELIVTLLHFLAVILFLLRYFQEHKSLDYILAITFFILSISSRDYSVVLLSVVAILFFFRAYEGRNQPKIWWKTTIRFLPFLAVAIFYLAIRSVLIELPSVENGSVYGIRVEPVRILQLGIIFIGNLLNLSFAGLFPSLGEIEMITGRGDLATLLTTNSTAIYFYKIGFFIFASLLMLWTVIAGVNQRKWSAFSLVWAIVIISPTFLVGNIQIYYIYESVAAIALLLAMALDCHTPKRQFLLTLWAPVLLAIGINGYAHNQNVDAMVWRFVANRVSRINEQIFVPNRNAPVRSLTVIVPTQEQIAFMRYLIWPPGQRQQAMLRSLLTTNEIELRIISYEDFYSLDQTPQNSMDLVYFFQEQGFSFIQSRPEEISTSGSCDSFEGEVGNIKPVWINNTNTSYTLNHNPAHISAGDQSIQVSVNTTGQADYHFGGIRVHIPDVYTPQSDSFAVYLWLDKPQNIKTFFVYVVDASGLITRAWINNNPGETLVAGRKLKLEFRPGKDNILGFKWSPQDHTGSMREIHFFVDVKEGQEVNYYLDQLCEVAGKS